MTLSAEQALRGLDAYLDFWSSIREETVAQVRPLVSGDMVFIDPFNEVHGVDNVVHLLAHMYEQCEDPRFQIMGRGLDAGGPNDDGSYTGFALWHFTFTPKRGGKQAAIDGMTSLTINPDGLVAAHIDHWDSGQQLLRKIPVLGFFVNKVLNMLAAEPKFRRP